MLGETALQGTLCLQLESPQKTTAPGRLLVLFSSAKCPYSLSLSSPPLAKGTRAEPLGWRGPLWPEWPGGCHEPLIYFPATNITSRGGENVTHVNLDSLGLTPLSLSRCPN